MMAGRGRALSSDSNQPPVRRRGYIRAVLLSFVIPFILLVSLVGGAGYLGMQLEKVQQDTVSAIGDWYKLDVSTRRRFSFHDEALKKDRWLQDIHSLEVTLEQLRRTRVSWLLGESVIDRFERTHAAWYIIKEKLLEGDALFQDAQCTTLGQSLNGMDYGQLVNRAFTNPLPDDSVYRDLWLFYRLDDTITNLRASGEVLGRTLENSHMAIAARIRFLRWLLLIIVLIISVAIVGGALLSAGYFTKVLKESEAQLYTLIETIPDLVWLKSPEGVFLSCNAKFQRLLGASKDQIVGRTDYDFADKECADSNRDLDLEVIRAGKPCVTEEEGVYADDGHRELLETVRTPMFDSKGKLIGVLGIARDITERKQIEEDLRITLNSIGDGVIATDRDGCVIRMNPVAEQLTGWASKDAKGRPLRDVFFVVLEASRERVESPVERVLTSGDVVGVSDDTLLISRDGKEYQVSDSAAPIRSDTGDIFGVVLVFRDVTQEHALQEQLRRSQKMESVGQLAGGIAHDFNNMLGGIIGSAELLEPYLVDDPSARKFHQMIFQSARQAARLTQNLLAFSRRQLSSESVTDLHVTIQHALSLLHSTIDRRVEIHSSLAASPSFVVGESAQLQSVFLNLGINASSAMPDGGPLSVSTCIVEVDEAGCAASAFNLKPGPHIQVEVRDAGCGIPEENLSKIFDPFFTTKDQGKGTGLGLSAAFGTIQHHGGSITVSSEEGKGTSFYILLPVVDEGEESVTPSLEVVKGCGTILFVDDEPVIRATAESILQELGYAVVLAEHGQEALEIYQASSEGFDLVILDMVMPVMNGRDCFAALRKINPAQRIILSSGFSKAEDVREMKRQGLSAYIRKPFNQATLSQVLRKVLMQKS